MMNVYVDIKYYLNIFLIYDATLRLKIANSTSLNQTYQ